MNAQADYGSLWAQDAIPARTGASWSTPGRGLISFRNNRQPGPVSGAARPAGRQGAA